MISLSRIKFIFFILIGIFIFFWVYEFFAGPESLRLITENSDRLYFLILAHIPTLYFDSLSWYILVGKKSFSIKLAFLITWIAQAAGKFFPTGNITGEFVRGYLGVKKGLSTSNASTTVFADLIIATFALFIISFFSFLLILFKDSNFFSIHNSLYFYISLAVFFLTCILIFVLIRKRALKYLINEISRIFKVSLKKKIVLTLLKIDFQLFKLSQNKIKLFKAFSFRIIGWICGAFEIYVFLWVIGIDASLTDVVILESLTSLIKAFAFFIPGGLGVQELAFVMIGNFLGFSASISFSIAIGRRIREIFVGLPAVLAWYSIFYKKL